MKETEERGMRKDSFVLYTKINEVVKELSDEQKGRLFQAILDYEETGEEPDLDHATRLVFIPIRQDLDINNEKWEQQKKARSEAGKKGMAARYGKQVTEPNKDNTDSPVITTDNKEETQPQPEKPPEQKPKKKRKTKAEKEAESREGKVEYAEFVYMTEAEHQKLIDKYGEGKVARQIEVLDNYKGSHGKTYSSDYRTILSWVAERVEEEYRRGGGNGAGNTWGKGGGATGNPPGRNFEPSKGFRDSNNTGGGESPGDQDADGATGGGNV